MKRPRKDPIRENQIHEEAIVDAFGPEKQAMGWYYYLEKRSLSVHCNMHRFKDHNPSAEG